MKNGTSGLVEYSGRGFHQDATDAMGGDIVRALIETITNSDDAYAREGHRGKRGKIFIEVDHRHGPWRVMTRDRAKGMTGSDMEQGIVRIAGSTSGFQSGQDVRGNLGRGAKDLAAFGNVDFESIVDERVAKLTLEPTGRYELARERSATTDDRKRLGIPRGNGTQVTINVQDNFRCPRHKGLAEKLSKHYQLRDILSDRGREVLLVDAGRKTKEVIRYEHPNLPIQFQEEIQIEGYPSVTAKVTICRNAERYDDPASDPSRPGGFLVVGKRAVYENSLFGLESNPQAGWFSGRVECHYIDDLAREYDKHLAQGTSPPPENPMPIIKRRRDGLQHNHPFYKKLAASVEKPLRELVRKEEEDARKRSSGEGPRMRKSLDRLGRDLSRLIDEDLRNLDDEGLGGGTGVELAAISVIPEQAVVYMGENKTLTVLVRKDLGMESVKVSVEPGGVVDILSGTGIELEPHKNRSDALVGRIRVRPLLEDEVTILTVQANEDSAEAMIEVRPERETVEVLPPEVFQFERERYRVAWGKRKRVRLLAPIEFVADHGASFRVSSSNPGVVALGGIGELILRENLEYYVGEVTLEGRTIGATATLRADVGTQFAACGVNVRKEESGPGLLIRIVDEEAGSRRALIEQEGDRKVIKIMGRHPVMKRYRGLPPELPGNDLPTTKCVLAEIVAGEAARMVMEKKFPLQSGVHELDAARLYADHYKYLGKYLVQCHRSLVLETSLKLLTNEQDSLRADLPTGET